MEPEPTLIVIKELAGNPPPHLNMIQKFLAPYTESLVTFWISVWIMTAIVLFVFYIREYRAHRNRSKK